MAAARGTPKHTGLGDLNLDTSGGGLGNGLAGELGGGGASGFLDPWARFAEQLDWDELRVIQTGSELEPELPAAPAAPAAADPPLPLPVDVPAPVAVTAPAWSATPAELPAAVLAEVEFSSPIASLASAQTRLPSPPVAELPT